MEFSQVIALASIGVSAVSVFAAIYAVRESRKALLSGTYFTEMADAYANYLKCVASFVYQRGIKERDALSAALYKLLLYAPQPIADKAQELYCFVLEWARSGQAGALPVDEKVNRLGELMRENVADVRRRGHF